MRATKLGQAASSAHATANLIREATFRLLLQPGNAPLITASVGAQVLLGHPDEDFLAGRASLPGLLHPDDRDIADILFSPAVQSSTGECNLRLREASGRILCIKAHYHREPAAAGVALELRLQDARSLPRSMTEMKTRFISVISHEFRTPMSAAMASAELLHNHADRITPDISEKLFARIATSFQRMTEMLNDVLLLNRMDAKKLEVQLCSVDLKNLVQSSIEEVRLGDKDAHRFELHATGDNAPFVTDPKLIQHILTNLLSNAVRYSPSGTIVTTRIVEAPEQIRIMVEDQGIGVPENDRARIFESFERGSNAGTIKGTGLGLNIVKRMTEMLGGTIAVDAIAGGGSRFTVTFPRA